MNGYFASIGPRTIALVTAPFVIFLVSLAVLPFLTPRFWEKNRNKMIVSAIFGAPIVCFFLIQDRQILALTALDYLAFIAFIGTFFVITGGIYVRGSFAGRPATNVLFLLAGSLLANIIGTVGASVLMIRPLLRANHLRRHKAHIVIFFIFLVSNCAGLLTALGDPPLFLGFLKGVEFFWTLRLWPVWALEVSALLMVFYGVDRYWYAREDAAVRKALAHEPRVSERFGIEGRRNLLFLGASIAVILTAGYAIVPLGGANILGEPFGIFASKLFQLVGMAVIAVLSYRCTQRSVHEKNRFSFKPFFEVAAIFFGVFATMPPALLILETQGYKLGVEASWQFFWISGALSSFLDNAPTYLAFTSLAKGVLHLSGEGLSVLMNHPVGARYLAAIACGAVMMGANTYIGNGPNFMVKAIAEHHNVAMPGFFGYMLWSIGILIPLFVLTTLIFFRGSL
ncbi:MAG: sodium:proton antiporter [Candidatus Omnitrophica bacterium]|nr:sodium:proton antiporter [Candidatus Omnitrophota bacterium]